MSWLTLILTPAGERQLDPAQRQAIATWCLAGGALFVTDPGQVAAWRAQGVAATVLLPGEPTALAARVQRTLDQAAFIPHPIRIPGVGQVPVVSFGVVVTLFAVIAGPVVLWWTTRRGGRRRHLLLVAVPALSLGTCTLLIAWGLMSDGLGLKRAAAQVVIVTPGQAVAWTSASYFAGLAPGSTDLDAADLVTDMDQDAWGDRSGGPWQRPAWDLHLDWTGGQRAVGGLVPARVLRQLTWVSPRPERRRLLFTRKDGGWAVTNGFDRAVTRLVVHAEGRRWALDGRLEPGASGVLGPPLDEPVPATGPTLEGESDEVIPDRYAPSLVQALAGLPAGPWYQASFDGLLIGVPGPDGEDRVPGTSTAIGRVE